MKNERGVTLISLTIYLIAFSVIIGLMAAFSSYFYKNVSNSLDKIDPIIEYSRLVSFFTEEANRQNIDVLELGDLENNKGCYIVFSDGVQYTFLKDNKSIYKNKAKICRKVDECTFNYNNNTITVYSKISGKERTNTFTLN